MASKETNYDEMAVLNDEHEQDGEETVKVRKARPRWYAVQVASGCEKKVKLTLEQRVKTFDLSNVILEVEIPQTPAVKMRKDGSRQNIEEKVFPGYVL
ncbi:MAG: transcription termination/antitermination NusG family protein, partial [Cyanobacteria bacterium P01_D01_bin.105]